jgi:hypothetical protein
MRDAGIAAVPTPIRDSQLPVVRIPSNPFFKDYPREIA